MNRRNFIKCTMGVMGSAVGISAVKADVIGPDITMPKLPVEIDWCVKGTEGTVVAFKYPDDDTIQTIIDLGKKLDEADVPLYGRYLADPKTGEIINFENLIDPLTRKPVRIGRRNG